MYARRRSLGDSGSTGGIVGGYNQCPAGFVWTDSDGCQQSRPLNASDPTFVQRGPIPLDGPNVASNPLYSPVILPAINLGPNYTTAPPPGATTPPPMVIVDPPPPFTILGFPWWVAGLVVVGGAVLLGNKS